MSSFSPSVLIKKIIRDPTLQGVALAERELELALQAGIPSLSFDQEPSATLNDVQRHSAEIYLGAQSERFALTYCGARQSKLGAYLLVRLYFHDAKYVSTRAHKVDFIDKILCSSCPGDGLLVIGQTRRDAYALTTVSGRRSTVFSYLLGARAGLDNIYLKPSEGAGQPAPLIAELMMLAMNVFPRDDVVSIAGWSSGGFVRECFRELSRSYSQVHFDERFGKYGVYWRPRSVLQWIRHAP